MIIQDVYQCDSGAQVVIHLWEQTPLPPMTIVPLNNRFKAMAKSLQNYLDLPENLSIIEVRAGQELGFDHYTMTRLQEYQLSYIKEETYANANCNN